MKLTFSIKLVGGISNQILYDRKFCRFENTARFGDCSICFLNGTELNVNSKTGEIVGFCGIIDRVKIKSGNVEVFNSFDGGISTHSQIKLTPSVSIAYPFKCEIIYDCAKKLLRFGDVKEDDALVRVCENLFIALRNGNISSIIVGCEI